jgi:hypothetical protein
VDTDRSLIELTIGFRQVMEERTEYLKCFQTHGVQLEGWLKGELLHFLDHYQKTGKISRLAREEPAGKGRRKVDFYLEFSDVNGPHLAWLEIKHWHIGYQKGCKYEATFYFKDPRSAGILPDVKKLVTISDWAKYLLILTTANPGQDLWLKGIAEFNQKFRSLTLRALPFPQNFLDYYFLGLLRTA